MSEMLKVRMKVARADEKQLLRVGGAYTLPRAFAQKLIDIGEAIPYREGDPDYVAPEGAELLLPPVQRAAAPFAQQAAASRRPRQTV